MEEIRLGASTHGYSSKGFAADTSYTVDTLYEKDNDWAKTEIIAKINANTYSIINHLGHSNYNYVMQMTSSDTDAINNTKFMFAYSQGCIPGDFERDCIAERLTTSNRYGMFAVVFNSRYGWGRTNSTDGASQHYDRQFWYAFFNEGFRDLGIMNADSHEDNFWRIQNECMRWCYYESNLLGDPATRLSGAKTASKQTFSISNTGNADLTIGTLTLTGTNLSEFSLINDSCSGKTIAAQGACTVSFNSVQ